MTKTTRKVGADTSRSTSAKSSTKPRGSTTSRTKSTTSRSRTAAKSARTTAKTASKTPAKATTKSEAKATTKTTTKTTAKLAATPKTTRTKAATKAKATPRQAPAPAPKPKLAVVASTTPKESAPALRKKELLDAVVARSGVKRKDAKPVVEAMLAVLGEALSEDREMTLQPFAKVKIQKVKQLQGATVTIAKLRRSKATGTPS